MITKSTTLLMVALLGLGLTANAVAATVYTTYTDRALFEAALTASTTEDFESYSTIGVPDAGLANGGYGLANLTLDDFSLTATPAAIKIWNTLHESSHNTTVGGSNFLYLDTDKSGTGSTTDFNMNNPVTAFGFDYTGVFGLGTTFKVTIGSEIFDSLELTSGMDSSSQLFWGVIGTTSFEKVTLITSTDDGYGVDEVTFGSAIPLPPAIWLFGSGLLALAGSGIKRRIRS